MSAGFTSRLTTRSTLADLPSHRTALRLSDRSRIAGDAFQADPRLPGILLGEEGAFRTMVSRRYYLDAIGRYCGMDLYHPRPLRFLVTRYQELGGPLVLHASTPIAEAVQRGLDRQREFVYEPLVVAEEARPFPPLESVRLVDFEDLLAAASRLNTLRAAAMRQILSSVREGLLMIDREQRIAPEYSDSVESLLGETALAGQRLPEVLARCLGADSAEVAGEFVETLFNPRVIEGLVEKINPLRQVTVGAERVLSFSFTRRREHGTILGLLVRVQDLSRETALGRDLERERRRGEEQLQMALALARCEPEQLTAFLSRSRRAAEACRALSDRSVGAADLAGLCRDLHRAKGDAGLLGLPSIAEAVHAIESELANPEASEPSKAAERTERLSEQLDGIEAMARRLSGLRRAQLDAGDSVLAKGPLEGLLANAQRFTEQLARELGKPARFVHRVNPDLLGASERELLGEALAQFLRNALAHGIEPPAERARAGKPEVATLQLVVRPATSGVEIVFQDDGRGLDAERLQVCAAAAGMDLPAHDHALGELIFRPGFSTADSVGLYAGRGVGLDAVRQRVLGAGGRIAVHSQPGRYCAFRILLPAAGIGALAAMATATA